MEKKRKPRLNTNTSSIMPYRYVLIKIIACSKVCREKNYPTFNRYKVTYSFDKNDYYYDIHGNSKFTFFASSNTNPYEVGKTYRVAMTID